MATNDENEDLKKGNEHRKETAKIVKRKTKLNKANNEELINELNIITELTKLSSIQSANLLESNKHLTSITALLRNNLELNQLNVDELKYYADLAKESKKMTSEEHRNLLKSSRDLSRLNQTLADQEEDILEKKRASADVSKDILKTKTKLNAAESALEGLEGKDTNILNKKEKMHHDSMIAGLKEQIDLGKKNQSILGKELKDRNAIEKQLGITGDIMDGLSKLGFKDNKLFDLEGAGKSMGAAAQKGAGTMKVAQEGIKKVFMGGAKKMGWIGLIIMLIEALKGLDSEVTEMSKGLNISRGEATNLRNEMSGAAAASGDIFVTTKKMVKAQAALNENLGTSARFSNNVLVTATKLLEKVKLSAEATAGLAAQSIVVGGSFEKNYKASLKISNDMQVQTGIALDLRQIMTEVGTTTGSLRAQLRGSTQEITKAVTNAQLLGMNLKQAANAGRTLLEFESSIENELTAELLTGKQLNLERARAAALTGDQITLQNELAKNMGDWTEFQNMNVLQQEALAAAIGMSSDDLSDILFTQQVQGRTVEELRAAGEDELANRLEATTLAEKNAALQEKLMGMVADAITGLLPVLELVGGIISVIGPILSVIDPLLKAVMVVLTAVIDSFKWVFGASEGMQATKDAWQVYGDSMVTNWGIEDDRTGEKGSGNAPMETKVEDFTLKTDPKDTIMIDNKNNVVAGGTNLGGNNLSKEDLLEALRTIEREKPQQNLIIRERDTNYADSSPINNQGKNYAIKYQTSFS